MLPGEILKDLGDDILLDIEKDSSSSEQDSPKKTVHFADSKGLALTSTHFFPTIKHDACCQHDECCERDARVKLHAGLRNGECVAKILNFRPPPSTKCLQETLERLKVCLEKTACYENCICGRIRVCNLAFEKKVTVRYTTDSWLTYEEAPASYVLGSSTGGSTDTFEFRIAFTQGARDSVLKRMDFAICYKVGEHEFWDNNFGDNYRLVYF